MDTSQLQNPLVVVLLITLAVWNLVWKGLALWRAAEKKSKPWFIVMLILNTAGILEIIYLFVVAPRRKDLRD
ncbi:MAG TPA: DUF5652 family protein [Pseudolysinimonas sp.]|nr:DUF5652 family protein [Pseudolysinimonas sp.]